TLLVIAQRDGDVEEPTEKDLYTIGTRAVIRKMERSENALEMIVQGVERVALVRLEQTAPYLKAVVRPLPQPEDQSTEIEALHRAVLDLAARAMAIAQPQTPIDLSQLLAQARDPIQVVYLIASMLSLDMEKEQQLLEAPTRVEALRLLHAHLAHEVQVLELRQKIASQAQTEMTKEQRDYLLRQQLRAIQQELGEQNPEQAEAALLRQRLQEADLPDEVRKEAERELTRLEKLPSAAPDYQLTRTHLELILELPWRRGTQEVIDLPLARKVLDLDHYDLEEIKGRI